MGGVFQAFTVGDQLLWGAAEPLRRMLRILLDARAAGTLEHVVEHRLRAHTIAPARRCPRGSRDASSKEPHMRTPVHLTVLVWSVSVSSSLAQAPPAEPKIWTVAMVLVSRSRAAIQTRQR